MPAEPTRIKICGIRDVEAATSAAIAGADYLGFNFVEGVRRQLQPDEALEVISNYRSAQKPHNPKLVGLFRNQAPEFVNEIALLTGLDYVQLCGDEDETYNEQMDLPIFRQVRVKQGTTPQQLSGIVSPHLDASRFVLLDSYDKQTYGGSGQTFDWAAAEGVANRDNVLLAGGLNPENIEAAIAQLSPWGVDVSSGVETDGVKDPDRIRAFISAVQSASPGD